MNTLRAVMRSVLFVSVIVMSLATARAQDPTFLVALKANPKPRSNDPGWQIEVGEVYRFVRFMTQSEYLGGSLPTKDRSFVVAKVGDVFVVDSVQNFGLPQDLKGAADTYNIQVQKLEDMYEKQAQAAAQRRRDRTLEDIRSELSRMRQLQELQWLRGR